MENAQAIPTEGTQRPWGFWPTIGLSVIVLLVSVVVSVIVIIASAIAFAMKNSEADLEEFIKSAASDGFAVFLSISLAAPVCVGLVLLFIRLKATLSVRDYLCLVPVGTRTAITWFAFLALLEIGSDLLTYSLGRPTDPEVMVELYRTSQFALSWFAIIIAAPIFEEILFRGFMFRGIQASRLGNAGAVLITAFTWAITHVQYDAYLIATIFVLGLLLGAARAITGSLYLTIAMHMVTNLIATIQTHAVSNP